MKKALFLIASMWLLVGCYQYQVEDTAAAPPEHNLLIARVAAAVEGSPGNHIFYYYTKDTKAVPPICTSVTKDGNGVGSTTVPCDSLKPYFGDK